MNNKFSLKSFIAGAIFMAVGVTTIIAAGTIKSAVFNANKVIFNGTEINLASTPMVSIVKEGEENFSNYMPVRAVLEAMGYTVDWDGTKNAVIVNGKKAENITISNPKESLSQPGKNDENSGEIINGYLVFRSLDDLEENINNYNSTAIGDLARQIYADTNGQVDIGYNAEDASFELFVEGELLFKLPKDKIAIIIDRAYIEKSYYDITIQPLVDQYKVD